LDDFALKLNRSKEEVVDFFKNDLEENFTDLLNQNRIEYFKELLKAKKYESFTIEALSEMSGFGTRRTMYSAFNKFVGMTPSDYINTLK
jgi:YesN/AraC family two-component response regulator